jgi:hypothetical protein
MLLLVLDPRLILRHRPSPALCTTPVLRQTPWSATSAFQCPGGGPQTARRATDEPQVLALLVGPPRVFRLVLIPRGDGVRYGGIRVLLVAEVPRDVSRGCHGSQRRSIYYPPLV